MAVATFAVLVAMGEVLSVVMPGLVPGIHAFPRLYHIKAWMAGTSPAMTVLMSRPNDFRLICKPAMADKSKKPSKLKARLPRGLADRGPAEIAATRHMVEAIRVVFERYGFEPVETPAIEYTDALGKFLPDQDRPNEGVFSFQDDDEQWLSLRYDLTAPLARYVAENYQQLALPYRSYRVGYVYRNEKPGPGRFRQFMQFDADTVGAPTMAADAEMCMLAADTMEALGIPRGSYVVKVNNRKVLDGVMECHRTGGDRKCNKATDSVSRDRQVGPIGRRRRDANCWGRAERMSEVADFTKGSWARRQSIDEVLNIVGGDCGSLLLEPGFAMPTNDEWFMSKEHLRTKAIEYERAERKFLSTRWKRILRDKSGSMVGEEWHQRIGGSADTLRQVDTVQRIHVSASVVRGLEYYTGPVYEVELMFETKDDKGRPVRFGSVGGGGRYDGLVSRFMGQPVPATGFSIGVSRLQAALAVLGKLGEKAAPGPVLVTVFGADSVPACQKFAAALRNAGIRAELYLGNPKHGIGQQLKYADKRGSPCAVIQGPDEKAKGEVQIRDLIAGSAPSDIKEREEYLKKQAEAQFAVAEDKLGRCGAQLAQAARVGIVAKNRHGRARPGHPRLSFQQRRGCPAQGRA